MQRAYNTKAGSHARTLRPAAAALGSLVVRRPRAVSLDPVSKDKTTSLKRSLRPAALCCVSCGPSCEPCLTSQVKTQESSQVKCVTIWLRECSLRSSKCTTPPSAFLSRTQSL